MKLKGQVSLNLLGDAFAMANQNVYLGVGLGLLLVFIQALIFNKLCIDHDVLYSHSYLPAYMFMLLNSVFPENLLLNPLMVVNFFTLFALASVFRLYQSQQSSVILFYTSLFFGMAALLIPVMYLGILFVVMATMTFKNINVRDSIAIVSGFLLPVLVLWAVLYLLGIQYVFPRISYDISLKFSSNPYELVALLGIAAVSIAGLMKSGINYSKNNIKTRRISTVMMLSLFFALAVVLIRFTEYRFYFQILTYSLSVQVAYFMLGSKGRRWKELLHYAMLLSIAGSLYGIYM